MPAPPRILISHDRAAAMAEVIRARAPDAELQLATDYAGVPPLLDSFRPDILLTVRFAGTPSYPRAAIHAAPSLRWIAVGGSGTDHLGAWDDRVIVTNGGGVGAGVMAEFAMAAIYAFAMEMPVLGAQQAARVWRKVNLRPLAGATLLVVGLGRVGLAVAGLARRNGMRVLGIRSRPGDDPAVDEMGTAAALPAFASRADYVAVTLPLTAATTGLLSRDMLAAMRPDAVLVNLARGGIVDEAALAEALAAGRLRGAALDVFATEPLPEASPFWALPNVLVTPHNAVVFADWDRQVAEHFCENLDRWRQGLPLGNVVAPP